VARAPRVAFVAPKPFVMRGCVLSDTDFGTAPFQCEGD
jgi:hypothetical protein